MALADPEPTGLLRLPVEVASRLDASDLEVVVTGGTGWMGRATLEMLESSFGPDLVARTHVFGSSARPLVLRSGSEIQIHALSALSDLRLGKHLVAHFAFATREFVQELGPGEYIRRNQGLTELVSDHLARSDAVGLFVPSSGAAYAGGDLDTNPYGALKRSDEERYLAMMHGTSDVTVGRVIVPRVFNLAGPFLNKPDRYALGSILTDIGNGGPVRLTAAHPVVRSYVHVADVVALAFAVLTGDGPVPGRPFDTAGAGEIEVGELASLATSLLGQDGMLVERPPLDGQGPDRYVGDPTEMDALVRAYGLTAASLREQIRDTARYLGV
jgi:UDP-glucuronate decarboxylase